MGYDNIYEELPEALTVDVKEESTQEKIDNIVNTFADTIRDICAEEGVVYMTAFYATSVIGLMALGMPFFPRNLYNDVLERLEQQGKIEITGDEIRWTGDKP